MNTFELEKVFMTFKLPEWDTGVFVRNLLRSPTEKMSYCATQTALTMKEPARWHSASVTKAKICTLTLMDYHLSSKNSAHFLKVMFALTMMSNCKDLSRRPVDLTVHCLPSTLLLETAWRLLSTGWRNTVMIRLKTLWNKY